MKKETMKAKVLDFVENKGEARYTDIIKFIVTEKFGPDAWDNGFQMEPHYEDVNGRWIQTSMRRKNTNRGYFAGALTNGGRWTPKGYFLRDAGYGRLEKQENGLYKTIR